MIEYDVMILDEILAHKRKEVEETKRLHRLADSATKRRQDRRDFKAALAGGGLRIIAEIKKASPSAGVIREDFDPARIARAYESGGASALSVLTDERFFQGAPGDLAGARKACGLPVLRKDFIIDAYQVYEANAWGADAVLLIVRALGREDLTALLEASRAVGLDALVEVHDRAEARLALDAGAGIIGVNNRDLATFRTDMSRTIEIAPIVRDEAVLVSESGIKTRRDAERLEAEGVSAILVGEILMRSADPAQTIRALLGK